MSEFKSGDIVTQCGTRYIYACIHPIYNNRSMVVSTNDDRVRIFYTSELKSLPKTHTVNGFEVPAPMSEAEFDSWDGDSKHLHCFGFASSYRRGFSSLPKSHISTASVKCGFVFKTESDVKKNIAALQDIDPSAVG